jgi:signal peptidase I
LSARARRFFGCILPLFIAIFGCGAMLMAGYAGQVFVQVVETEDAAMAPLLPQGVRAFVDATAFWADPPRPGRVVYINSPDGRLLRHLVAQPGDTLEIRRGRLILNDLPCDGRPHPEVAAQSDAAGGAEAGAASGAETDVAKGEGEDEEPPTCTFVFQGEPADFGPLTLGEDEFFVLAEDAAAADSRSWGPLAREALYGIALFTVNDDFSFDAIATPEPDTAEGAEGES